MSDEDKFEEFKKELLTNLIEMSKATSKLELDRTMISFVCKFSFNKKLKLDKETFNIYFERALKEIVKSEHTDLLKNVVDLFRMLPVAEEL